MTVEEWLNNNKLSIDIFNKKYKDGKETFEEFIERVSHGYEPIKKLIEEKKFLFGGRILASRGVVGRTVTYSNCYVVDPPNDDIESIFACASKIARTYSYGGGVGIDLSNLRPNGATVHNASKTSSGPVSFMDMFSQVTQTISQNGRRGALMISLDINHPDIEEFIDCKTDLERVKYANISVRVNDEFMRAVTNDRDYILRWPCDFFGAKEAAKEINPEYNVLTPVYGNPDFSETKELFGYLKKVKAREIFNKLVRNNWDYAEPGILYWDRIQGYNLLDNTDFKYAGTNPCAEEPLPAGGSCLLGSINLAEFVKNPFSKNARVNFDELEEAVMTAVVGLNQVLIEGLNLHPLQEQRDSVRDWRQIGLGTMGLGDMLIKLQLKYGSEESLKIIDEVYKSIAKCAVQESLALAKAHGCYPKCDKEKLAESSFIQALNLPRVDIDDIRKYGLYNSQLLTCAPTGSIGTMLQISTGVEPNFALSYTRKTQSLDGKDTYYQCDAKIVEDYKRITGDNNDELPDYFVTSGNINPIDRVKVQSVLQKYTDASISSTVNLPKEATVEDVYNIYIEAWRQGLKGITVYRSGCKREGILTTESKKEEKVIEENTSTNFNSIIPISRDTLGQALQGNTFKYSTACGTLYTTINKDSEGNIVEIFTNSSKNGTCKANLNGETRLASLALRAGVKVEEVVASLKSIQCQSCAFAKAKGNKIDGTSCPDIMAKCLKASMTLTDFSKDVPKVKNVQSSTKTTTIPENICPECGEELKHVGGCVECPNCGYSKCG